ncbi:MAG: hypothetical protein Q9172_002821 [Xanthocarpia lactea]
MHYPRIFLKCLLCLLLFAPAGYPVQAAEQEQDGRNQGRLRGPAQYLNIVRGLFLSKDVVKYISQIPCDIVQTLEKDADEAEKFVDELQDGKVPSLIENLPEEIISSFTNVFGLFLTLPSDMVSIAENTVESAVNIFNDIQSGAILSDLEEFDDKIVSGVTDLWGDFTAGFEDAWGAGTAAVGCFITTCAVSSDALGSCQGNTAATTTGNGGGPSTNGQPTFQASVTSTFSSATPVQTPAGMPSSTVNTQVLVPSFTSNTVVGVPSLTNNIPAGVPSANNPPANVPSPTDNTPTVQTSALVNPSAGASASPSSLQIGASAKNLPGVFMLKGITKVFVLAVLGLLGLFVWL